MIEFGHNIGLCVEGGYLDLPANWSADEMTGFVSLESVELGLVTITATAFKDIVGHAEYARQVELTQDWWVREGWREVRAA